MAINDNVTVVAGTPALKKADVESKTKIYHAQTGKEYKDDAEADSDVSDPATSTKKEDIKKDVTITVNSIGEMVGKVMDG